MISLIVPVVIVALIFGGFYYWARRQGLLTTGQAAEGEQGDAAHLAADRGGRLHRRDPAAGWRRCRDRPALEQHRKLGAGGRPRWRGRVLPPDRHRGAPGPRPRDPAAGRGGVVPFRGLRCRGCLARVVRRRTGARARSRSWSGGLSPCTQRRCGGSAGVRCKTSPCSRGWSSPSSALLITSLISSTAMAGPGRLPRLWPSSRCGHSGWHGRGSGGDGTSNPCG